MAEIIAYPLEIINVRESNVNVTVGTVPTRATENGLDMLFDKGCAEILFFEVLPISVNCHAI